MTQHITQTDRERAARVAKKWAEHCNEISLTEDIAQAYVDERARCNARLAAGRKLGLEMASASRLNGEMFTEMQRKIEAYKPIVSAACQLLRATDVFDLDTFKPTHTTLEETTSLIELLKATRASLEGGDL